MSGGFIKEHGQAFSRSLLEAEGFEGWVPFSALGQTECPRGHGVYAVYWPKEVEPEFLKSSRGGWFKGKDPTVSTSALNDNWVANADIIYIGCSHGEKSDLRKRLSAFRRFGDGKAVGHWGGRLIWQIAQTDLMRVGWKTTERDEARSLEKLLLERFIRSFDRRPFANLTH